MTNIVKFPIHRIRPSADPNPEWLEGLLYETSALLRKRNLLRIPPDTICMCYHRETRGDSMCVGCPANDYGDAS